MKNNSISSSLPTPDKFAGDGNAELERDLIRKAETSNSLFTGVSSIDDFVAEWNKKLDKLVLSFSFMSASGIDKLEEEMKGAIACMRRDKSSDSLEFEAIYKPAGKDYVIELEWYGGCNSIKKLFRKVFWNEVFTIKLTTTPREYFNSYIEKCIDAVLTEESKQRCLMEIKEKAIRRYTNADLVKQVKEANIDLIKKHLKGKTDKVDLSIKDVIAEAVFVCYQYNVSFVEENEEDMDVDELAQYSRIPWDKIAERCLDYLKEIIRLNCLRTDLCEKYCEGLWSKDYFRWDGVNDEGYCSEDVADTVLGTLAGIISLSTIKNHEKLRESLVENANYGENDSCKFVYDKVVDDLRKPEYLFAIGRYIS